MSANDTLPNGTDRRGWVAPALTRGTINIIQTCLTTLFICLYTAFHDDIPLHPGRIKRLLRRVRWMITGVIAPEFVVILAGMQFFRARTCKSDMQKRGVRWTLTHGFYANMGGYVLVTPTGDRIPINSAQIIPLFEGPRPDWWPTITEAAIIDKSKADFLAKFLALLQAVWLVAQIIGRAVEHLSISPLEIETAAYVPLTLLVYLFWLKKPLNVEVSTDIMVGEVELEAIKAAAPKGSYKRDNWRDIVRLLSAQTSGGTVSAGTVMFLGMIFGAVHCLAWDVSFPTSLEQRLWRTASCLTIVGGFFAHSIVTCVGRVLRGKGPPKREGTGFAAAAVRVWDLAGYPLFVVYFVARFYLIFESFFSLRSLPADAFDTVRWSQYVPHF